MEPEPHGELDLLTHSFSSPVLNSALCTDPGEMLLRWTCLSISALKTTPVTFSQAQPWGWMHQLIWLIPQVITLAGVNAVLLTKHLGLQPEVTYSVIKCCGRVGKVRAVPATRWVPKALCNSLCLPKGKKRRPKKRRETDGVGKK